MDAKAFLYFQQLSTLTVLPMTIDAVVKLGVMDAIVGLEDPEDYISAQAIALKLGINHPNAPRMLDRMLSLLASYDVVASGTKTDQDVHEHEGDEITTTTTRCFGAKPVCRYLTSKDAVTMFSYTQDKALMESWYHLKDAVVDGDVPFHMAHGMTGFEYMSKDSRLSRIFNTSLSYISTLQIERVLSSSYVGFDGVRTLVNVGGGNGVTLSKILAKHPTLRGINFDLPHVIAEAPQALQRVEHVGGDMFERVPPGDAVLLKYVLHDWTDGDCFRLLKNCRDALPDRNGKVIVIEGILPPVVDTNDATKYMLQLDLFMLANTAGGRERTEKEFESLAKKAGFSGFKVACDLSEIHVMEFIK